MLGDHVLQLTLVPFRINLREARLLQLGLPCDLGRRLPQFREYCRSAVCGRPADTGLTRQIGDRQKTVRSGRAPRDKPGQRGAKRSLG